MRIEKQKLDEEIKKLTIHRERIRTLRGAELIVVAPGATSVALRNATQQYQLLIEAEGEASDIINRAAIRQGIPRIPDAQLASRIARDADLGEHLDSRLYAGVRTHLITSPFRKTETEDYLVYHSLRDKKTKIGYLASVGDREFVVQPLSSKFSTVRESQVRPGSAMRGAAKELMQLSGEVDYLDFVALEVGNLLSDPRFRDQRVCLAVNIGINTAAVSRELERVEQKLGSLDTANLLGLPIQAYFLNRALSLGSRRRGGPDFKRKAEDELYKRLVSLGVHVVERQDEAPIMSENERLAIAMGDYEESNRRYAMNSYATHVLYLDVGEAKDGGDYEIATRVVRCSDARVLWAETSESYLAPPLAPSNWQDRSGEMVLLHEEGASHRGSETSLAGSRQSSRLAFTVGELGRGDTLAIRELFGRNMGFLARSKVVKSKSRRIKGVQDVGPRNRMRFLTWRLSQPALPVAGRFVSVDRNSNEAIVAMAGASRVAKEGDYFNAVRVYETGSESRPSGLFGESRIEEQRLPYQLIVAEASANSLRLQVHDPSVDVLWSEGVQLEPGDVAQPRYYTAPKLAMAGVTVMEPSDDDKFDLKWRFPARRKRIMDDTTVMARLLDAKLRQAFQEIGLPLHLADGQAPNAARGRRSAANRPSNVTHRLYLSARRSLKDKYHVRAKVVSLSSQRDVVDETIVIKMEELREWSP